MHKTPLGKRWNSAYKALLNKKDPQDERILQLAKSGELKIGVVNQWLYIRDGDGIEGYIAAWYVSTTKEILPEPEPTPTPEPEPGTPTDFIIQALVDGLALRSQPIIAEETLLKRLPFDAELLRKLRGFQC